MVAQATVYLSEPTFNGVIESSEVFDFESETLGSKTPPISTDGTSYSFIIETGATSIWIIDDATYSSQGKAVSTGQTHTLSLTNITGGANALSGMFFITNTPEALVTGDISLTVNYSDSSSDLFSTTVASPTFAGFVAPEGETIVSLVMGAPSVSETYNTIGALTFGQVTTVPEPTSASMFLGLLAMLIGARRSR